MGDRSILTATLDMEKIGKTFHHALKHGTNLVWLASDASCYIIAQVQLSCKNKSTKVIGIAGFSVLSKMQACLHERCRQQRYVY